MLFIHRARGSSIGLARMGGGTIALPSAAESGCSQPRAEGKAITNAVTAISTQADSTLAGAELGRRIREGFEGEPADAILVFGSARHDHRRLLEAMAEAAGTRLIVGSSSAGEFGSQHRGEGTASALGLRSANMRFAIGVGRHLSDDPIAAAGQVVATFQGPVDTANPMPYHAALVMTDALAGHADVVIEELTMATGGNYRFFGGGAGDDARFEKTWVFAGTEAFTNAVVALEIRSMHPVGIGVAHGWVPAGKPCRVTETDGARLISLNGAPAVHAFEDHAADTGQAFSRADPMPFFLHNVLGIKEGEGYRLRVPLGIGADGSILCAAAVPDRAIVRIMKTSQTSTIVAAEQATRAALQGLGNRQPAAALIFDCVATRLRLGVGFDDELKACAALLAPAHYVGCNTHGQIARAEGQFGGFHNCTAVVCAIPS